MAVPDPILGVEDEEDSVAVGRKSCRKHLVDIKNVQRWILNQKFLLFVGCVLLCSQFYAVHACMVSRIGLVCRAHNPQRSGVNQCNPFGKSHSIASLVENKGRRH